MKTAISSSSQQQQQHRTQPQQRKKERKPQEEKLSSPKSCWIERSFMPKDMKPRYRERYRGNLPIDTRMIPSQNGNNISPGESKILYIPDASYLRKYLTLIEHYVKLPSSSNGIFSMVLLESVAEAMDVRNSYPKITKTDDDGITSCREVPCSNERQRIKRLVENFSDLVWVLSDLTLILEDDADMQDEFDTLEYSKLDPLVRSRYSLGRVCRYLSSKGYFSQIVILTGDLEDFVCDGDREGNISVQTCEEFLKQHGSSISENESKELEEIRCICEDNYRNRHLESTSSLDESGYCAYWNDEKVQQGLSCRTLLRGTLEVSKYNCMEGYVTTPDNDTRYYISANDKSHNRALHNDKVIFQILPENKWHPAPETQFNVKLVPSLDPQNADSISDNTNINDETRPKIPSARIVAILSPSRRKFVATFPARTSSSNHEDNSHILCVPMNIHTPKIRIKLSNTNLFDKRILVQMDAWPLDSRYPHGHVTRVIGPVGSLETEMNCLMIENEIDFLPFSPCALQCLPNIQSSDDWSIPQTEILNRLDLRYSRRIFSVDPEGCQDIDDTMHSHVLPSGDIEIGVHIADVDFFCPQDCHLDQEAKLRGTTFYFVDRRIDMLPSLLSSDLCSLHANRDRLAVSVIWTFSKDWKSVKNVWFGRTIIQNCQAMTYEQAHRILQNKLQANKNQSDAVPAFTAGGPVQTQDIPKLKSSLRILTSLARYKKALRQKVGGAVDLSATSNELKFTLDSSSGIPKTVSPSKHLEIHDTIAELMILANGYVAAKIHESFPNEAVLRVHQTVQDGRFGQLGDLFASQNLKLDGSNNKSLATSLQNMQQHPDNQKKEEVISYVQSMATRAMSEAKYVCTGSFQGCFDHYGLGLQKYTHFTSPIRRYADVLVHRFLFRSLELDCTDKRKRPEKGGRNKYGAEMESLPSSQTMSVLNSVSNHVTNENETETSLEQMSHLSISDSTTISSPYTCTDLTQITHKLNHQNRIGKRSSRDCQTLFLSLYLRTNVEYAPAVITSVRKNGFIVYVPKFDFKGAVFLSDKLGNVFLPPVSMGLERDRGWDAKESGWGGLEDCRMFPDGKTFLEDDGAILCVTIPGAPKRLQFKLLDMVTVRMSAEKKDGEARVAQPKLHFMSLGVQNRKTKDAVTCRAVDQNHTNKEPQSCTFNTIPERPSMFHILHSFEISPEIIHASNQSLVKKIKNDHRVQTLPGRLIFSQFRTVQNNPSNILESPIVTSIGSHDNYNKTQQMEREVTTRMQRLESSKRNARVKSKQKK